MTDKEILIKVSSKIGQPTLFITAFENDTWSKRDYYEFIFSHNFAKVFWGEEDITEEQIKNNGIYFAEGDEHESSIGSFGKQWQYHLQQMVLEKEPLKYLERFLEV